MNLQASKLKFTFVLAKKHFGVEPVDENHSKVWSGQWNEATFFKYRVVASKSSEILYFDLNDAIEDVTIEKTANLDWNDEKDDVLIKEIANFGWNGEISDKMIRKN